MSDILPKRVNTGRYKRAASRAKSQSKSAFSRRASRIDARSRSNTRYTQNTENTEGNDDFGTTETSFGQETSNSRNERSEESPSRDRLYRNSFNRQNSLGQNSLGPISESESCHSKSTQNNSKNYPINIHRPIYTEKQVYRDYGDREGKYLQFHQKSNKKRNKGLKNRLLEPFQHPWNYFKRRLPPLKWVPEYMKGTGFYKDGVSWWKRLAEKDLMPGIIVGLLGVPEGIAFSILAGVGVEHGIYTSIFPVFIYCLFGTSKHAAVGTYAITTLLTGFAVRLWAPMHLAYESIERENSKNKMFIHDVEFDGTFLKSGGPTGSHDLTEEEIAIYAERADYASTLALIVGLMMFVFGICRLGFLLNYFSDALIAGLTLGASIQVVVSQIPEITGLHIKQYFGPGNIFFNIKGLIEDIGELNKEQMSSFIITLGLFVASLAILAAFEVLERFLDRKFEHLEEEEKYFKEHSFGYKVLSVCTRFHLPPGEICLLIIMIVICVCFDLEDRFDVELVGNVPKSYKLAPKFFVYPEGKLGEVIGMAFLIFLIGYFATVHMMRVIAEHKSYNIDANQELVALGLCNIISSFLGAFPCFLNLARTFVYVEAGAVSQFSAFISASLMLLVKEGFRALFEALPKACLAAIVCWSVYKVYGHVNIMKSLWVIDKMDTMIYVIAVLAVCTLDMVFGLVIGLVCCLFSVIVRSQMAPAIVLTRLGDTEIYKEITRYCNNSAQLQGIKIIKFLGPLHFMNRDKFREQIDFITGISVSSDEQEVDETGLHTVIIDCSCVSHIDYGGIKELRDCIESYSEKGVYVELCCIPQPVEVHILTIATRSTEFAKYFSAEHMYPTVHDCVCNALLRDYDGSKPSEREQLMSDFGGGGGRRGMVGESEKSWRFESTV